MSKEISLTITKILNWTSTDHNVLLEIAFYASKSRAYLAHKTALGSYSGEALLLNTSFKIQYSPEEHIVAVHLFSSSAKLPQFRKSRTPKTKGPFKST